MSSRVVCGLALILIATLASAAPRSGEIVFNTYCNSCHGTGWNGAPITGIRSDWEGRVANGFDSMLSNVRKGLNTMPPMGTCLDCTDEELKAAIQSMLKFD